MAISEERRRRGQETIKRYKSVSGTDVYAAANDAIADILLYVAKTSDEARQMLHGAEIEFNNELESEDLMAEG
jgi:hypothetical protein